MKMFERIVVPSCSESSKETVEKGVTREVRAENL